MVKLDNWETKAEKAAERRVRSKELKNRKQQTRQHKALAQQLLSFLQDNNDAILRSSCEPEITMDIWTDTKIATPSIHDGTEDIFDWNDKTSMMEDMPNGTLRKNKVKGRARANSLSVAPEATAGTRQKGRLRSNSDASTYASSPSKSNRGSCGRKSGKLRSGSSCSDSAGGSATATTTTMPLLCRKYFFGNCSAPLVTNNMNATGGISSRRKSSNNNNCIPRCASGLHWLMSTSQDVTNCSGGHVGCSPTKKKVRKETSGRSEPPGTVASTMLKKRQTNKSKLSFDQLQANQNEMSLEASSESAASHFRAAEEAAASGGMDMLCHHGLSVPCHDNESGGVGQRLADALSSALSQNNWPIGSIAYVVMKDMLVFDRYRNGMVLSDVQQELLLCGGSKRRSISMGDYGDRCSRSGSIKEDAERSNRNIDDSRTEDNSSHDTGGVVVAEENMYNLHQHLMHHLPAQVLEFVLSFLPVSATAILPQVCRVWNYEIGRSSPNLWRNLLKRHKWSRAVKDVASSSVEQSTAAYRDIFVSHYKARRDLRAIKYGLDQLLSCASKNPCSDVRGGSSDSKDVAAFDFQDTIGTPIVGKTVVQMWSDTRVLVGSGRDCTLHLYDIIDNSSGPGKRCKQSVRVKVIPFANTRKRPYELRMMQLDADNIGCLFATCEEETPGVWLVVLQKEELLCAGKGGNHVSLLGEGVSDTFDLKKEVLACIARSNDNSVVAWLVDHNLRQDGLIDAEVLSVTVATDRLVACGDGNFLFEAYIALSPALNDYNTRTPTDTLGKIFLISLKEGRITWTSPHNCDPSCVSLARISTGAISACFASSPSKAVSVAVKGSEEVECLEVVTPPPIHSPDRTVVAITPSEMLLADQYMEEPQDGEQSARGFKVTFHSVDRENSAACLVDNGLFVGGIVAPIISLRDGYIIVFCASNDAIADYRERIPLVARLFHIPSRQVIHEASMDVPLPVECAPLSFACDGGSVAVSARDIGMFVAGHGVSHTSNDTWGDQKKAKKKKWIRGKAKKDGFARGMRQSMG